MEGEQGLSKEQLLIKIRFFAGVAHKYNPRKCKSMSRVSPKSSCSSKFAFLRVLLTNTDPANAFCSLCLSAAILLSCSQYVPSIYHRCRRNPGSLQDSTGPATGRRYKDKRPVFRASHLHFRWRWAHRTGVLSQPAASRIASKSSAGRMRTRGSS